MWHKVQVSFALFAIIVKYNDGNVCLKNMANLGRNWLSISSFFLLTTASNILFAVYSGVKPFAVVASITENKDDISLKFMKPENLIKCDLCNM